MWQKNDRSPRGSAGASAADRKRSPAAQHEHVEKPWFKKVWLPLTMQQISIKGETGIPHTQLDMPTISITSAEGSTISITSDIFN